MKKYQPKLMIALLLVLLAVWAGRSYIRNLFPPGMKFYSEVLHVIDNNQQTSLKDLRGNVLLVSCYQTWCIDCARETPVINELAGVIHSEKFKVIYISDEEAGKVNAFRQRFASDKILFTQYPAGLGSIGIRAFPTTFLLNKKGTVVKTKVEGYDWLKEEVNIKKMITE